VIRRATLADASAVAAVNISTWRHAYGDEVDVETMPSLEERVAQWRERLAENPSGTVVFDQDGRIAGYASFGADRDGERAGELYAIYVDPPAQGAGVGSALIEHAVQALRDAGHRRALLWTLERNGLARAFYERHGWTLDARRRDHPWGAEVRYSRHLPPPAPAPATEPPGGGTPRA
jgi:GNAT superfamily N-acetyltransferase